MSRPVYVQYAAPLAIGLTVLGVVMLVIGTFTLTGSDLIDVGDWAYYLVSIGAIAILVGVIWIYSYLKRVKHFKELMKEKSKKSFVANLDDLEYTAWRLPKKFEDEVSVKKKEFNVK